ncbi:MAG TPA: nucleotide exchange factor GrpE [Candidatus Marinimicrobia bacterium]|nr:nucleotide exchange factor GrpE [Candidatus Neomarinimicrobiota bacterium]
MKSSKREKGKEKKQNKEGRPTDEVVLTEEAAEMIDEQSAEDKPELTDKKDEKIEKLFDELKQKQDEIGELNNRYLRLLAEFDNYKKRAAKDFERSLDLETEKIISRFLPVADDLSRALLYKESDPEKLYGGIKLVLEKMMQVLKSMDVEPFDSVNQPFDPDLHDALLTRIDPDNKEQIVLEEFEKGYRYKNRVFRHAKVVVSVIE